MAAEPEEKKEEATPTVTTLGDRVLLTDKRAGFVAFIGPVPNKTGTQFGVILDTKFTGDNNGTLNGVQYFKAPSKHGVFITQDKIKKSKPGDNADMPRVTVGSRVKVGSKSSEGLIMFLGPTSFGKDKGAIWYGVKLDKPNGKNNGQVVDRRYFTCKDKYGTFVKAEAFEIVNAVPQPPKKKKKGGKRASTAATATTAGKTSTKKKPAATKTDSSKKKPGKGKKDPKGSSKEPKGSKGKKKKTEITYEVGDKVEVKPSKKGEIRWIGEDRDFGENITFYGVRLSEKRGDCDGEYKGKRYFNCPTDFGVYVQKKLLVRKLEEKEIDFDFGDEEAKYAEERAASEQRAKDAKAKRRLIREHFKGADADGGGTIDKEEWMKMADEVWPSMSKEEQETLFTNIDGSGNGNISFAEFTGYPGLEGLLERVQLEKKEQEDTNVTTESTDPPADAPPADENKEDPPADAGDAATEATEATEENKEDNADAGDAGGGDDAAAETTEATEDPTANDDAGDAGGDAAPADPPAEDAAADPPADADAPAEDAPADNADNGDGGDEPAAGDDAGDANEAAAEDAPADDAGGDEPAGDAPAEDNAGDDAGGDEPAADPPADDAAADEPAGDNAEAGGDDAAADDAGDAAGDDAPADA